MSWFSLVIGQNTSLQLETSSENLVASAKFLVALATSESQFRALPPVVLPGKYVLYRFVEISMYKIFGAIVEYPSPAVTRVGVF